MSQTQALSRRSLFTATAAVGGGLALGWSLPGGASVAAAQGVPGAAKGVDVGIWVVIQPDDITTVRIAHAPKWVRAP